MIGAPLRVRLWWHAHNVVNRLAWRFARPAGPTFGIANRIDKAHPLWRLNDWVAGHWTGWYVEETMREHEQRLRDREQR